MSIIRIAERKREPRKKEASGPPREMFHVPDALSAPANLRKGFLIMFGLVPFVSDKNLEKDDDLFSRFLNAFDEPFLSHFSMPSFKVDVKENKDSYDLTAELPGLKKENISLTYDNHYLTIATRSEKHDEKKDEKGSFLRQERSQSAMSRSFYIDNIDESKCTADYQDGILSVHMPKLEQKAPQGHTIAINGAA